MKLISFLILTSLWSCSHHRGPASLTPDKNVAEDTMALGNVKATAVKSTEGQDVCFDVQVTMKGVHQKEASPSNWTLAWVDQESKFHLLTLNQRDPASEPKGGTKITSYGAWEEWSNTFRTCAPQTRFQDVKSLVLTPKELTYKENESLKLEWK